MNLIKGKVFIQIPTLVLNTPIRVAGSSDMEQVVGQFFGDLSLGATPFQEVRLQDEHQGHSLAREIVPFMQEAGARGVQASTS